MKQIDISRKTGISQSHLCQIVSRLRRPSWENAKKLSRATETSPILWLEGTEDQIKGVLAGELDDPFGSCSLPCHPTTGKPEMARGKE